MDCFRLPLPKGWQVGYEPVIKVWVGAADVHGERVSFME
jgi:hypothetical protein